MNGTFVFAFLVFVVLRPLPATADNERCGVVVYAVDAGGKILGVYGKARPVIGDAAAEAVAECRGRFKTCRIVHKTCAHGGP